MTNSQIVYTIQNLINRGGVSDDTLLSNRQVQFIVNYIRAATVKKDIEAKKTKRLIDYTSFINCLKLIKVNAVECCNLPSDCLVLRTEQRLPSFIDMTFVGTLENKAISQTTIQSLEYDKFRRYGAKEVRYFEQNNYLYVMNSLTLKYLKVGLIAEDPATVAALNSCGSVDTCPSVEYEYPMPMSEIQELIRQFTVQEIRTLKAYLPDTLNNANQDN